MKIKPFIAIIIVLVLLYSITSCSKDNAADEDNGITPNSPPETFSLIGVPNNSTEVDILPTFIWEEATDSDGDSVTYSLYLAPIGKPLELIDENLTSLEYTITTPLSLYENYNWKVIAKDAKESTRESEVFSFSTRGLNIPNSEFHSISVPSDDLSVAQHPLNKHTLTKFNGKLWIIGGGYNGWPNNGRVWYSEDGINWSKVNNVPFENRRSHTTVVFNNKIWIIGGAANTSGALQSVGSDVWYSDDGFTWTEATLTAPFGRRYGHSSVVFDDKIWVIGGIQQRTPFPKLNDVWYSEDGTNWTELTSNTSFPERVNSTSTVFNNHIWVIGGNNDSSGTLNDIWCSSDGLNWIRKTSSSIFSKRSLHSCTVYNSKIWVIGGFNDVAKNDIWYSKDGENWTAATSNAPFSGRYRHDSAVFDGKIWVIGGQSSNGSTDSKVWIFD